jgi:hypothetical protein
MERNFWALKVLKVFSTDKQNYVGYQNMEIVSSFLLIQTLKIKIYEVYLSFKPVFLNCLQSDEILFKLRLVVSYKYCSAHIQRHFYLNKYYYYIPLYIYIIYSTVLF